MNIGIIGAGNIARVIPEAVKDSNEIQVTAVASRSLKKAQDFAAKFGIKKAYGSYEELLADPEINLIYIATPHSHHYEHMRLCLNAGKNVLCEKSFTMNAAQAKEVVALAKEKNLYLAEAIWTRYMPSRKIIDETIKSGLIGKITNLTANLSYELTTKERLLNPELCGGALLDVGVYPINFALMHFGKDIDKVESSVKLTDRGVDGYNSISIYYKDGRIAQLTSGLYARSDRKGIFWGEKGYIVVENINNPQSINVYDDKDQLIKSIPVPSQVNGYEYEVIEADQCIKAGKRESTSMPFSETIYVMEFMDKLRKEWGLIYPMEK
ncbi:Gfo/Idh/MocA family oxidoreductase [Treponema sp.]|uniref:Gfo/Idh/MocA family protein n=1 Tax=Treponema sp. TaxID=166 RepID=UPI0025D48018|nr:Gfo/Idh/MocA family oxidoreductase [Treponema sp.]MCR5218708.1 Gfo/Idh/MocA family oxidoreductase [Treponema sp.]